MYIKVSRHWKQSNEPGSIYHQANQRSEKKSWSRRKNHQIVREGDYFKRPIKRDFAADRRSPEKSAANPRGSAHVSDTRTVRGLTLYILEDKRQCHIAIYETKSIYLPKICHNGSESGLAAGGSADCDCEELLRSGVVALLSWAEHVKEMSTSTRERAIFAAVATARPSYCTPDTFPHKLISRLSVVCSCRCPVRNAGGLLETSRNRYQRLYGPSSTSNRSTATTVLAAQRRRRRRRCHGRSGNE